MSTSTALVMYGSEFNALVESVPWRSTLFLHGEILGNFSVTEGAPKGQSKAHHGQPKQ